MVNVFGKLLPEDDVNNPKYKDANCMVEVNGSLFPETSVDYIYVENKGWTKVLNKNYKSERNVMVDICGRLLPEDDINNPIYKRKNYFLEVNGRLVSEEDINYVYVDGEGYVPVAKSKQSKDNRFIGFDGAWAPEKDIDHIFLKEYGFVPTKFK